MITYVCRECGAHAGPIMEDAIQHLQAVHSTLFPGEFIVVLVNSWTVQFTSRKLDGA